MEMIKIYPDIYSQVLFQGPTRSINRANITTNPVIPLNYPVL